MADKGGLEGIVVARSRLCSIDGQKGVLIYGGYDVGDLAEHSSYEETCFLILRGRLPRRDELEAFTSDLAAASPLSDETAAVIDMLAGHAAPMEMLRTAVSADSFDDPDKDSNTDAYGLEVPADVLNGAGAKLESATTFLNTLASARPTSGTTTPSATDAK